MCAKHQWGALDGDDFDNQPSVPDCCRQVGSADQCSSSLKKLVVAREPLQSGQALSHTLDVDPPNDACPIDQELTGKLAPIAVRSITPVDQLCGHGFESVAFGEYSLDLHLIGRRNL